MVASFNDFNFMPKVVVASGGFDPLHEGHVEYLRSARSLGDILIVGVNSDEWLVRKKGYFFQNRKTRSTIIQALRFVDIVIPFDDSDGSANELIKYVKDRYIPNEPKKVIFVNGGDRGKENIPEQNIDGVEFVFGVGGLDKKNSSSDIIAEFCHSKCPFMEREVSLFDRW